MANNDGKERDFRIRGLSYFQSGVVFLMIATVLLCYVAYQVHVGRVITKSGEMPLCPGLPWAWLMLESFGAVVGIVRGFKMLLR